MLTIVSGCGRRTLRSRLWAAGGSCRMGPRESGPPSSRSERSSVASICRRFCLDADAFGRDRSEVGELADVVDVVVDGEPWLGPRPVLFLMVWYCCLRRSSCCCCCCWFFTSISTSASIRPSRSSTCRLWFAAADSAVVSGRSWLTQGVPRRRQPSQTRPAKDSLSPISSGSRGVPSGAENVHRIFLRLQAQQLCVPLRILRRLVACVAGGESVVVGGGEPVIDPAADAAVDVDAWWLLPVWAAATGLWSEERARRGGIVREDKEGRYDGM